MCRKEERFKARFHMDYGARVFQELRESPCGYILVVKKTGPRLWALWAC